MNEENNGFGPLAKRRGLKATYAASFALFVAMGILCVSQSGAVVYMGLSFLAVLLGELFRRVFLLCEEFQHRHTRYEGKFTKILKTTFAFQHWKILVLLSVISVAFVIYGAFKGDYVLDIYSTNGLIFAINVFALPALLYLVGLRQPSPVEESELGERENRNVADGLAWSYYFGYLKIVLPELKAQINDSGEEYRHKIKPHKLFILLPKNCFVRQLIKEADTNVQEVGDLKELKRNQAGIKERSYKHTVHKIKIPEADGGGEHYILVEYATPLKTLYCMSEVGALSREERDQQVMIFICKLKEILDVDKECRGKYELITFSGNNYSNIAEVLLRAINDPSIQLMPEEEVPSTHV